MKRLPISDPANSGQKFLKKFTTTIHFPCIYERDPIGRTGSKIVPDSAAAPPTLQLNVGFHNCPAVLSCFTGHQCCGPEANDPVLAKRVTDNGTILSCVHPVEEAGRVAKFAENVAEHRSITSRHFDQPTSEL